MKQNRLDRALLSLEGLSVGDAYGECAFRRDWTRTPWPFTDDTVMALSIVEVLARRASIDADALAAAFLRRYRAEPARGYGAGMHAFFGMLAEGTPWHVASRAIHGGKGSFGNGSAMRVPPLGAYFADDIPRLIDEAARSAAVTHAHPEAAVGATAVALATAHACDGEAREDLFEAVLCHLPPSFTREGVEVAQTFSSDTPASLVAEVVGNGSEVTCADTVPFVLWCARAHLDDYSAALHAAISVGGDRDTIAAMVGGIVVMRCGQAAIPKAWRQAREALPLELGGISPP